MPTVLRFGRWRVTVYPNDHRPAHVHVIGADTEAVFYLNCPDGSVELRENYGFSRSEIRRIRAKLNSGLVLLCDAWKDIHERT